MPSWLTGLRSKKENKKDAQDLQWAAAERADKESQRSYLPAGRPSTVPGNDTDAKPRVESSLPDERAAELQSDIQGIQSRAKAGLAPTEYEEHILRANGATDEDINKLQNKGRAVKSADGDYIMTDESKQRQEEAAKVENDVKANGILNATTQVNPDKMERDIIPQTNAEGSANAKTNNVENEVEKADESLDTAITEAEASNPQQLKEAVKEASANAGNKIAESVADKLSDKRAKYDTHQITRNIFDAYANGEFGEPGTADAKMARNYFLMDSLLTASKNWAKRDEHYIHNLQNIVSGREATDYDSSNDEKSRWQQMKDRAQERYEAGQDILAKSDYETAANIGTQEQNAEAAQNMGTQGMANAAAMNQISSGNFDALTQAAAQGDEAQVKQLMDATLNDVNVKAKINELTRDSMALDNLFDEQSFDSRLQALVAQNAMTSAEAQMLLQKVSALKSVAGGIEGLKNALASGSSQGLLTAIGDGASAAALLKVISLLG